MDRHPHPLSDEVLIELGRVTWAVIGLEDLVDTVCSFIRPANPRIDRRSIGQKVGDARRVLRGWGQDGSRVDAWLVRAAAALEERNAFMHSTPLVSGRTVGHALGELPRTGRPYRQRPMTVDSLHSLRMILERADKDWQAVLQIADRRGRTVAGPVSPAQSDTTATGA